MSNVGNGPVNTTLTGNGINSPPTWQAFPSGSVMFTGDSGTPFNTSSVTIFANNAAQNCGSSVWFDATTPNITLNVSDSQGNTIIGQFAGNSSISGSGAGGNTVLGATALDSMLGPGTNNVIIGYGAGTGYTNQESGNILIGSQLNGNPGENNITRIGYIVNSPSQVGCYIDGINSVNSSGFTTPKVVFVDNVTGQLGYGTTSSAIQFSGDFGTPFTTSSVSIITDITLRQCGSTVRFSASTPDITLNVSDSNGNTMLGFQAGNLSNVAPRNTGFGQGVLSSVISMGDNSAFGYNCMPVVTEFGNSGFGSLSLLVLDSGVYNTCIGLSSGDQITAGGFNIAIGYQAGHMWISGDSSNINIGNVGANESYTIRIGTQGNGSGQQNLCYIAGIEGASFQSGSPTPESVIIDTSTGQLISSGSAPGLTINVDASGSVSGSTLSLLATTGDGSANAGASVAFIAASGTEIDLQLTDLDNNTYLGNSSGNVSSVGNLSNTAVGGTTLASAGGSNTNCVAIGYSAMFGVTGESNSVAIGSGSYSSALQGGSYNTFIGASSASGITTSGQGNILIGYNAGSSYTGGNLYNIVIGGYGVTTTDNYVTQIGFIDGATSQTSCYIDGIAGQTFTSMSPTPQAVIIDTSTGQLISTSTFGVMWSDQSTSFIAVAGASYFITGSLTATLPTTPSIGSEIEFVNTGTNILIIQAGTGDTITVGTNSSTAGGTLTSIAAGDSINLVYQLSSNTWFSFCAPQGNWTPA